MINKDIVVFVILDTIISEVIASNVRKAKFILKDGEDVTILVHNTNFSMELVVIVKMVTFGLKEIVEFVNIMKSMMEWLEFVGLDVEIMNSIMENNVYASKTITESMGIAN